MPGIPLPPEPTQLIVFADDWGRHPSSSQHLVRELLPQYKVLWVNTVGTRRPSLRAADLRRAAGVLASWLGPKRDAQDAELPDNLSVIAPTMYPGYRRAWQRIYNTRKVSAAVRDHLLLDHRQVVITTLPTTADLWGHFRAERWVYYCVDDYSKWPGTDHAVMDAGERELAQRVDAIACVSQTLRERMGSMGRADTSLITHGVELDLWQQPDPSTVLNKHWPQPTPGRGLALFWGLIDARLDREWTAALGANTQPIFAGPVAGGVAHTQLHPQAIALGQLAHRDLPAYAAEADVLIMPYIDAPVTRAMQPLKLLEYLATMRPVVVRDLPSTRDWADCCDVVGSAHAFAERVAERAQTGTPPEQIEARRRRLPGESWSAKAEQLAAIINGSERCD